MPPHKKLRPIKKYQVSRELPPRVYVDINITGYPTSFMSYILTGIYTELLVIMSSLFCLVVLACNIINDIVAGKVSSPDPL